MDMDDDPIPRTFVNTTSSNYNTAYNNNKNVLDKEKKVSELYAKKEEPKPKKIQTKLQLYLQYMEYLIKITLKMK